MGDKLFNICENACHGIERLLVIVSVESHGILPITQEPNFDENIYKELEQNEISIQQH